MEIKEGLFYTKEHEWVKIEDNKATVGITDYAQHSLVDVTFVELPDKDIQVEQFAKTATIESVKAVSDVYAPLAGKIIGVNDKLEDQPELVNQSPYEEGWLFVLEIKDINQKEELMDSEKYKEYLKTIKE